MSDEFMKIATQEINDELSSISTILDLCQNDADVSKNSDKIEEHMHKIKGLANDGKGNYWKFGQNP